MIEDFVSFWAVPLFLTLTASLWLLDRPGGSLRGKTACLSGLSAAALGLLISQAISHFWIRDRPFIAHPHDTFLLVARSHEPSFPSDHAVAAFAIACSVALLAGRRPGVLLLVAATVIAISRVFVGLHYPGDVAGGALIGLLSSLIVYYAGGGRWKPIIQLLSTITDPLVAPAWKALDGIKAKHRTHISH